MFTETFIYARPAGNKGPAFNVWTNDDGAIIESELPGFKADGIDLSVLAKTLTIRAERKPFDVEGAATHRRERAAGNFERSVELPFRIEADKVEAKYERGVLTITVPRAQADKRRTITINAN
jgi:HSP20 family protein